MPDRPAPQFPELEAAITREAERLVAADDPSRSEGRRRAQAAVRGHAGGRPEPGPGVGARRDVTLASADAFP